MLALVAIVSREALRLVPLLVRTRQLLWHTKLSVLHQTNAIGHIERNQEGPTLLPNRVANQLVL